MTIEELKEEINELSIEDLRELAEFLLNFDFRKLNIPRRTRET